MVKLRQFATGDKAYFLANAPVFSPPFAFGQNVKMRPPAAGPCGNVKISMSEKTYFLYTAIIFIFPHFRISTFRRRRALSIKKFGA